MCTGVRSGLVVSGDRCEVCTGVTGMFVHRCEVYTGVTGVYVHRCQVWAGCLW